MNTILFLFVSSFKFAFYPKLKLYLCSFSNINNPLFLQTKNCKSIKQTNRNSMRNFFLKSLKSRWGFRKNKGKEKILSTLKKIFPFFYFSPLQNYLVTCLNNITLTVIMQISLKETSN